MKKAIVCLLCLCCFVSLFAGGSKEATVKSKDGGTVHYYISAEPTTLNAWDVRLPNDAEALNIVYEYIMRYNNDGSVYPYLIESVSADNSALTYTLKLKSEPIKFHDGSLLTAEVLAWNLNEYKARGVLTSSFYGSFGSAEAVDDKTVVIHMNEWDNLFIEALARTCYIVSKEAYDKYGNDYLTQNPVGTGPFMFDSWEHDTGITLVKFDDYWRGTPHLDAISLDIYTDTLVAQIALEQGDLDVLGVGTAYTTIMDLEKNDKIEVKFCPVPSYAYTLCFECNNPDDPLYDVRVRQAIWLAIDVEAIKNACSYGYAATSTQWCMPGSTYYNDEIVEEYSIEKAKQLLAEAGYPNGFSTVLSGVANSLEDGAQIICEQLKKIGIDCELNIVNMVGMLSMFPDWKTGMWLHPMGAANGAAAQMSANLVQGLKSGLGIGSFLHTDEMNEILTTAKQADETTAIELYKKAAKIAFKDDCMMKVVMVASTAVCYTSDLKDAGFCEAMQYAYDWHLAYLDR